MDAGDSISISLDGLVEGTVVSRPNRFVAMVRFGSGLGTEDVRAHVADSGRLEELLFPGNKVLLKSVDRAGEGGLSRSTDYDLVLAMYGEPGVAARGPLWVAVDTRYPNRLFGQAVRAGALREFADYRKVEAEYWYDRLPPWKEGQESVRSRMDFFLTGNGAPCLVEVKSVTLCRGGVGLFPDAPTDRGVRHLKELAKAADFGYRAFGVFIAQRWDVQLVAPNRETDPAFADAMKEAQERGVTFLGFKCSVTPTEIRLDPRPIPVVA